MSQAFYDEFDPLEQVYDTMIKDIEGTAPALQTNFSGGGVPSGIRRPSQFWSDVDSETLKVRLQDDSDWKEIFNFAEKHIFLQPGQIVSADISTADCRKGTIVENEAIFPAECSIRGKFRMVSVPALPNELVKESAAMSLISQVEYLPKYTSKIYVPAESGKLYMVAFLRRCSFKFLIGTNESTISPYVGTTSEWTDEMWINTSGLSGWYDLEVQVAKSGAGNVTDGFGGIACRWEVE
jgi:hypothetical protein